MAAPVNSFMLLLSSVSQVKPWEKAIEDNEKKSFHEKMGRHGGSEREKQKLSD